MILEKYSMGVGDRFAHQGIAQLRAIRQAKDKGVSIAPVWNKSNREHSIIGTQPVDTRREADEAVKALNWQGSYYVDADHIGMSTVEKFIDYSDFFTLDVADFIGRAPDPADLRQFVDQHESYIGTLSIPNIDEEFVITRDRLEEVGRTYIHAIKEAARLYRYIESKKGKDRFITEVSMDETETAQSPVEMLFILSAISHENIPAQTIAPKFTGRFNKGVDYAGDVNRFSREFEKDLAVIAYAVRRFDLPDNLKLSVHSGSDKFSIYEPIKKAITAFDAGLHLKTAGTTWLEELIGLALAGGDGLDIAREVYFEALDHFDELCAPYAAVIDIDKSNLPSKAEVSGWNGDTYARVLRHDLSCDLYNLDFRQLLHVGYKVAAKMGERYLKALKRHSDIIAENVTQNIYERHIQRLFPV